MNATERKLIKILEKKEFSYVRPFDPIPIIVCETS